MYTDLKRKYNSIANYNVEKKFKTVLAKHLPRAIYRKFRSSLHSEPPHFPVINLKGENRLFFFFFSEIIKRCPGKPSTIPNDRGPLKNNYNPSNNENETTPTKQRGRSHLTKAPIERRKINNENAFQILFYEQRDLL